MSLQSTTRRRSLGAGWALWFACVAASAEPEPAVTALPAPLASDATTAVRVPWPLVARHAMPSHAADAPRVAGIVSRFAVVELPPEPQAGATGRRRTRHALSIASSTPKAMLQSIGIPATDCATRIRVPSSFKQTSGGGTELRIEAQIGLACRF